MKIENATASNTAGFAVPRRGFHAKVARVDGRTVGIGGYYVDGPRMVVFLELAPQARASPVTLCRALRQGMNEASARGLSLQAALDESVPGAARLLEHLGFARVAQGVFQCRSMPRS